MVLGSIKKRCLPSRSTSSEPHADTVISSTVPLFPHLERSQQGCFAIFNEARVHGPGIVFSVLGDVHDNLAKAASNAGLFDCAGEAIEAIAIGELYPLSKEIRESPRSRSAHHALEETGRAGLEHLADTQPSGSIPVSLGEVTLQHPDALAEPRNKLQIVGSASEKRLGGMHVGGDQSRNDDATGQIELFIIGISLFQQRSLADVGNRLVGDANGTVFDDAPGAVDGDDGGVSVQHDDSR